MSEKDAKKGPAIARADVVRIAAAMAVANGHSHPKEWAEVVATNWEALETEEPLVPPAQEA